jgi:hypothetical protein
MSSRSQDLKPMCLSHQLIVHLLDKEKPKVLKVCTDDAAATGLVNTGWICVNAEAQAKRKKAKKKKKKRGRGRFVGKI